VVLHDRQAKRSDLSVVLLPTCDRLLLDNIQAPAHLKPSSARDYTQHDEAVEDEEKIGACQDTSNCRSYPRFSAQDAKWNTQGRQDRWGVSTHTLHALFPLPSWSLSLSFFCLRLSVSALSLSVSLSRLGRILSFSFTYEDVDASSPAAIDREANSGEGHERKWQSEPDDIGCEPKIQED